MEDSFMEKHVMFYPLIKKCHGESESLLRDERGLTLIGMCLKGVNEWNLQLSAKILLTIVI